MTKEEILKEIDELRAAIEAQDVLRLIHQISVLKIESRGLRDYASNLIIEDIKKHIIKKGLEGLRIFRKGEYGDITTDIYKIENNTLLRNGTDVKWTNLGKLYIAYKRIHRISEESKTTKEE